MRVRQRRTVQDPLRLLTRRERAVAALLARGCSDNEIAQRLHITYATVRQHVGRIFDKLGVRTRVDVVRVIHRVARRRSATHHLR